jgi:hypothetical protein
MADGRWRMPQQHRRDVADGESAIVKPIGYSVRNLQRFPFAQIE